MSYTGSFTRRAAMASLAMIAAACASAGRPEIPSEDRGQIQSSGRGMEELFAGRFPGVEVLRVASGGISIRIRGTNTLLGTTEPLYIIDGARVQSGPGGLLFLDPAEIKNIEVLKDIGSTAIYGSDGANGVVIITTKRSLK
ncbi:MAG TPA: TonB-dependent receptor plug domain-containing protein [Gemmatimonadaceae bacterium]